MRLNQAPVRRDEYGGAVATMASWGCSRSNRRPARTAAGSHRICGSGCNTIRASARTAPRARPRTPPRRVGPVVTVGLGGIFAQKRNLLSPRFWGLLRDITRFFRHAPKDLVELERQATPLGDYLQAKGYGDAFRDDHLLPQAAAIWSTPLDQIGAYPAASLIRFFLNHGMMTITGRGMWRTVDGGSRAYVAKLAEAFRGEVRKGVRVAGVRRDANGAEIRLAGGARWENVRIKIDDYHTIASTTLAGTGAYGGVAVSGGAPKFDDVLINGGVIVEPVPGIRAYASYAEGYTVPDVGRIARAVDKAGVDIDSYVNISPITSNNREIGLEVRKGPVNASAAYFWSTSKNGSLLVMVGGSFEVQRQRVEIQGLELNLSVTPARGLTLSAGYAHLKGRTDGSADAIDKVDRDLDGANISPDRLNLAASYEAGPIAARVQTQFFLSRDFERTPGMIDPTYSFDGYNVTDASIRYQTRLGGISFAVQNLFDKFYIDYYTQTVRPTDNAHFYAGRGRNFTLSWDCRF